MQDLLFAEKLQQKYVNVATQIFWDLKAAFPKVSFSLESGDYNQYPHQLGNQFLNLFAELFSFFAYISAVIFNFHLKSNAKC